MALRAMHSAASGMEAHQFKLDTIANNLANASTTAFKSSRANFQDLFYHYDQVPGAQAQNGQSPVGISVGLGTRIASTTLNFQQGTFQEASGDYQVAIKGDGFFAVQDGDQLAFTRDGNFTLNADGNLVLASAGAGRTLDPPVQVPINATGITITEDGRITYLDENNVSVEAGQILLTRFPNRNGLLQLGNNLYQPTLASGDPIAGITPNEDGAGIILHRNLEVSNVEPVTELVDLIKTQRNFELNSQTIQAADQMLQLISNLRRF